MQLSCLTQISRLRRQKRKKECLGGIQEGDGGVREGVEGVLEFARRSRSQEIDGGTPCPVTSKAGNLDLDARSRPLPTSMSNTK